MPIRRLIVLAVSGLLVAAVAFTIWQGYQLQRELTRAESSVTAVRAALSEDDARDRDQAIADLQDAATDAANRTGSAWWGMLTHAPFFGDDAHGLRVLSRTLALVSTDGVAPMAESVDELDGLTTSDRIDLDLLDSLQAPINRASQVFTEAAANVNRVDTSGFLGFFDQRYADYADELDSAAMSLRSADTAVQVLPDMVGADGERDYLLLFQNNAEIRATGGMPGSWALIHAEDGRLEMAEQGTASDFPTAEEPVVPLTSAEVAVYGEEYGRFFQDPGFAPDFPRGAEMWKAHWERKFPETQLDGVLALDPVGMSYLLDGTGPVTAAGRTLTSDNAVEELLSRPYLELDAEGQDAFFEAAARAIFEAATEELASPVSFVEGFERAAREGRFLVASVPCGGRAQAGGKPRAGGPDRQMTGRRRTWTSGSTTQRRPRCPSTCATEPPLSLTSCADGRQQLSGRMTLSQTISPSEAAKLPASVTGPGDEVTEPGAQTVLVRIYGPHGGSISDLMIDGRRVAASEENVRLKGVQVVTVVAQISTRDDVVATWTMESGEGQTGDVKLGMTPSVVPGNSSRTFASGC